MLDETMFLIAFTAICVVISAFFFAAPPIHRQPTGNTATHGRTVVSTGCRACSKSPTRPLPA
ncbi:MAG: hypothetical protein R3A10_17155 [Caldilineaceae bacterium]